MVTVVIPAYNVARWVGEALLSVQTQSADDWECVVVDDASTDGTGAAARSIVDPRIRVITHATNRGVSAAMNTGIGATRGEYIQILDPDDLIQADKLRYQAEYLDRHRDIGIVYGDLRYFDDGNPTLLRRGPFRDEETMFTLSGGRDVFLRALLERNGLGTQATLTRRRVFDEVGRYDESLRSCEDYEWCLRAAMADVKIAYAPAPNTMALCRRRSGNLTLDYETMAVTKLEVHRRMDRILTGELAETNRRQHVERLQSAAYVFAYHRRPLAATRFFMRALRLTRSWRERAMMLRSGGVAVVRLLRRRGTRASSGEAAASR